MKTVKGLLPWIIAAAILYYLFTQYPPRLILKAINYLNIPLFLLYAILYFLFMWLTDCLCFSWLLTRFGYPTKTLEVGPSRFASYLLMTLHFGAGQGALAWLFTKNRGIPFFKSSSLLLMTSIVDIYWTVTLGFLASWWVPLSVRGIDLVPFVRLIWGVASAGLLFLILFFKLPIDWHLIRWVRTRDLFHTFHEARLRDYLATLFLRLPMHLALNSVLFFVALTFQCSIPLKTVLAYSPLATLVGSIPITPSGLGTTQAAVVELLSDHLSGALLTSGWLTAGDLIFYMSLLFTVSNFLLKILTGAFFVRRLSFRKTIVVEEVA